MNTSSKPIPSCHLGLPGAPADLKLCVKMGLCGYISGPAALAGNAARSLGFRYPALNAGGGRATAVTGCAESGLSTFLNVFSSSASSSIFSAMNEPMVSVAEIGTGLIVSLCLLSNRLVMMLCRGSTRRVKTKRSTFTVPAGRPVSAT